jgi:group I intron endonuclease
LGAETTDDRPCFIYAITHVASGQRYVGSCLYPTRRWIEHKSRLKHGRHHCSHLQRAWNKHGTEAFAFTILTRLTTNDRFTRARAELIAITERPCFNSRIANLGLTNFVNNPETRAKINAGISKRLSEDEELKKWLAHRGAQLAAHARTPAQRAIRAVLTKKLWTDPSHRKRVSKKLALHWQKPGVREEHSERVKLHRGTQEARKLNSDAVKQAWANPNSGLRNRKQTRWADPTSRGRQAEKMRAIWAKRRSQTQE